MKIQKGQVQYKDRDDYFVTYGITDDGKQYYFIDKDISELKNGNRIATTALVEAIDDMVKASNVGVIDNEGVGIIPFVNRRIKPVTEDILLVEASEAIDQSVKDAVALKNDPQSATTLVSTTTSVKDKINAKMSGEGRFIFNDLFSEATLYDIDGNNLVNNEYYSFIATDQDKILLSKNSVDSDIVEYPMKKEEVVTEEAIEAPVSEPTQVVDEQAGFDLPDTPLDSVQAPDVPSEVSVAGTGEVQDESMSVEVPEEEPTDSVDETQEGTVEESSEEIADVQAEADDVVETPLEVPVDIVEDNSVDNSLEVEQSDESINLPVDEKIDENVQTSVEEPKLPEVDDTPDDLQLNFEEAEEKEEPEDTLKDSEVKVDSIVEDSSSFDDSIKDLDILDGTKLFNALIRQNREMKNKISSLEDANSELSDNLESLSEKNKMLLQKNVALNEGRKRDRSIILKYQNETAELEKRVGHLERINVAHENEIEILRSQVQGKEDLIKLFPEAKALLGEENIYDDDNLDYYGKAA